MTTNTLLGQPVIYPCFCQSYVDNNNELQDCTCGQCEVTHKEKKEKIVGYSYNRHGEPIKIFEPKNEEQNNATEIIRMTRGIFQTEEDVKKYLEAL